ncbi:MAG: type II toxin-antitoxin system RelE/ParE family toxin [Notoacmeibacter sp.]|nr:type II toxin-antitoxin system RelE/ParE family toxin [Notoacmeibacter sp.]
MEPEIVFAPAAKRELKKLTKDDQRKIVKAIEALPSDPRPRGVEKVKGHPKFYRIKAGGDHRVVYHIIQERLIVILVIRNRKDAYKTVGNLDNKLNAALLEIEEEVRSALGHS